MATTIHLSPDKLKKFIKKSIEKETGKKVESVSLDVETRTVGFYTDEHDEKVFTGATITLDNDDFLNLND